MAYEIISQNNTTTTLSDGEHTIVVPGRVTLATSTSYTITDVNNNTATLEDGDGNVIRDVPCVAVLYGGSDGGDSHNKGYFATQAALEEAYPTAEAGDWAIVGETDTVWVWDGDTTAWVDTDSKAEVTPDMIIVKSSTMPTASTTPGGAVYQYVGATDSTYTHGYIYENKVTTSYDSTVSFEAATLSSSTIACSGSDFATFVAEWGSGDITTITNGTITYDQSGGLLVFVGKDSEDTTVCTFQLYTEDYQDAGFTITGTLQDGDVFAFTTTITESFSYAWTRIDVQPAPVIPDPLPSQTGNAGKFLTTDGTDASWSDKPLVNAATATDALTVLGTPNAYQKDAINIGTGSSIGSFCDGAISIGRSASVGKNGENAVVIGMSAQAYTISQYSSSGAVIIGKGAQGSGTAVGANATSYSFGVAVGSGANSSLTSGGGGSYATAVGHQALAKAFGTVAYGSHATATANWGIAIGGGSSANSSYSTQATAIGAIQIGRGVNSTAGTMFVALTTDGSVFNNYEVLSSNGTIPHARLTNAVQSTTVTIATTDWSSNTATVTVSGLTATSVVWVAPDNASQSAYTTAGVYASAQAADTLTFTCTQTPSASLTINVVFC